MHHLSSPAETREYLETIIVRLRCRSGEKPLRLPVLLAALANEGNSPTSIVLVLNAIAQLTDLDDETEAIAIQLPYERHSDETLARMVWQRLLAGACAQHPASS